jgi:serine/threonine protein kinase
MKPTPPRDNDGIDASKSQLDRSLIERMRVVLDGMSSGESTSAASLQAFVSCINCLARTAPATTRDSVASGNIDDDQEQLASGDAQGQTVEAEPNDSPMQFKQFEIREMLGHGGFGVVFRAFDTLLGRDVALKFPRLEQLGTPHTNQRLLREAQSAAVLNHPGIVPVYETGELGSLWYIASSYIDGPTLAAWQQEQAEPVAPRVAARIVAALADAVDHAHQRGILHLDLKPSNVLLEHKVGDGEILPFIPRLTDFGLAGRVGPGEQGEGSVDIVGGTLRFMSPEQVRGDRQQIGTASDIYGLGAVLYKLLTGRAPFGAGATPELARRIETEPVRSLRETRTDVSRDLDAICLKCLAKQPSDRYASARALADDLRRFVDDFPVAARPVGRLSRFARACRRRPALTALSAGVVVVLLTGTVIVAYHREQAEHHATVARVEKERADQQTQEAQEWLLEASQVIQETAPYLAKEQTAIEGITARIHAHQAQLAKANSSPELHLAALTASASLDAMGAQQATPLQPEQIVESRTRHAVDMWLQVIEHWPERLAYRRALALLLLGAARYYERAELPRFAIQYRAEATSILSPVWREDSASDEDRAEMARQLERLAIVRDGIGHTDNANCLRRCAVENWSYLRTKSPENVEYLTKWAIAQRQIASNISVRQQPDARDRIFARIEAELDTACDWEAAPASLHLVMADLMCRRASRAGDRQESKLALEFLDRAQRHLSSAEQLQPRDAEGTRVRIFMLREAAASHDALGQEREAYDHLKSCRAAYQESLAGGSDHEPELLRYARLCRSIGTKAIQFGESDQAISAFSEVAAIYSKCERLNVKDMEANAQCLVSLAKLYASAGNDEMAESHYRRALDFWRRVQKRMPRSSVARAEIVSIERWLSKTANDASESVQ